MSLVQFKAFLWPRDAEAEIRRFTVDGDVAKSYCYLKEKLCVVFPLLKRSPDFNLLWKDSDGDEVTISSDEELSIAIDEMLASGCIKIHVNLSKTGPTSVNIGPTHFGVICDGCDTEIVGFRYKCLECNDYDLCANCEARYSHSEHFMLRISAPINVCPPLTRRLAREVHRFSKKADYHHRRGHSPNKHERKCPQPEKGGPGVRPTSVPLNRCPAAQSAGSWLLNLFPEVQELILPSSGGNGQQLQDPSRIVKRVVETLHSFVDPTGSQATNSSSQTSNGPNVEKTTQSTPIEKGAQGPNPQNVPMETESGQGDTRPVATAPLSPDSRPSTSQNGSPSLLMETGENNWTIIREDSTGLNGNVNVGASSVPGPSKEVKTPVESPDQNLYPTLPIGRQEPPRPKSKVDESLEMMLKMGFNDEGGLLRQMLEEKNGNIEEVLEIFLPYKKKHLHFN